MSLTCEQLVDLLVDYVDGGLPPEQVEAFKQHLCGCKPCGVSVEMYQFTIQVSRALPKCEPLPPSFEARLRQVLGTIPPADERLA